MPSHKVTFTGSQGDTLAARLDLPDRSPQAYALFAHCFTCTKDIFAAAQVARALAARGIAVLRFDFTGLGHSDGEFANTTFSSNIADLVAAADHLRATYRAPSIIIGHSLGGAAVLGAAPRIPEVKAVATIGAPSDPHHVTHLFDDARAAIERDGHATVNLAGRTFTISRAFIADTAHARLLQTVADLHLPLLVMHAPRDAIVGIDNAGEIFAAAKHPKSFVSLDDADHLLTRKADAVYAADVIAAWAARYVPGLGDAQSPPALPAGDGEVVVSEAGQGPFAQHVTVGRHRLAADEPTSIGGHDTGPTPYGLLLAALGTCTAMTLRMYADRKDLALRGVTVRLNHHKVHAADSVDVAAKGAKIDRISLSLELTGDLDDPTRARLLEIAHRCPVHQTLKRENIIAAELAPAQPHPQPV